MNHLDYRAFGGEDPLLPLKLIVGGVAVLAAGVIGVVLAVLIVKSPMVTDFIGQGATDLPPFPLEAALVGLDAATLVGAPAGLLSAIVAVRVKAFDAIRF